MLPFSDYRNHYPHSLNAVTHVSLSPVVQEERNVEGGADYEREGRDGLGQTEQTMLALRLVFDLWEGGMVW